MALVFLLLSLFQPQQPPAKQLPVAQELRSQAVYRISGTVVDALTGQHLARTRVFLAVVGQEDSRNTQTNLEGKFVFQGLAPGKYRLMAQRRGYRRQAYEQHEIFATAIVVGPGLDSEKIRFPLQPGASISGHVLDENGEPLRQATVVLIRDGLRFGARGLQQQGQSVTNDEGRYHFSHLDPGTYLVAVSARVWYAEAVETVVSNGGPSESKHRPRQIDPAFDQTYPITFYSNASEPAGAARLTLHSGDAEIADFLLRAVPSLHLLVRGSPDDSSRSVAGFVTESFGPGVKIPVPSPLRQVEPGLFEITGLQPGQFVVGLTLAEGGEQRTRGIPFTLSSNAEMDLADMPPSSTLSGTARMADGSALPQNAIAQLRNLSTGETLSARIESSGAFDFRSNFNTLIPGRYEFAVFQGRYLAVSPLSATGAKLFGHVLEIAAGRDVHVSAVLSRGGTPLDGMALRNGKPAPGVLVLLIPDDPDNHPSFFRRTQSDSDGTFTLLNAFPGHYTVLAFEDGWNLEWGRSAVLEKYLPQGESVDVAAGRKYDLKVKVQ